MKELKERFDSSIDIVEWGIRGYILGLGIGIGLCGWLMNELNSKNVFIIGM
ncbi:hypothetical protein [Staphylococcus pasteuri]|uniref:hypothetical protein n=1 Tax=Staphylococcus pasteuri TaxID=45972 RepID=UPI0016499654|nr:hypothetical protein [Staphylococcus pasteuri]